MRPDRGLLLFVCFHFSLTVFAQCDDDRNSWKHPTATGVFLKRQFSISNRLKISAFRFRQAFTGSRNPKSGMPHFHLGKQQLELALSDNFDSLNRNRWRVGQPWGRFHAGFPHQYYDDSSVSVRNGYLYLSASCKPDTFVHEGRQLVIPWAVGLINSDISFSQQYGYFEIRSMNPAGPATWPAFWLTGEKHWPPEIDIFEMYGKKSGKSVHRQQTNVHWGINGKHSKGEWVQGWKVKRLTDSVFHTYGCLWTPDFIRFYTDGQLVRQVRMNRRLRCWFAEPMVIILNQSVDHRYQQYRPCTPRPTDFIVDYIRVYRLKSG